MCIRDSKKQRLAAALTFLEDYDKNGNKVIDRIAVSYTHLDVYKRQREANVFRSGR